MEMICAGVALCLTGAASGELGRISAASLVAVILGWWLLGEQISGHTLLAAAAIAVGVALIMLHPRKPGPGQDETGDQPRQLPAAQLPAPNRHQRGYPSDDAPSGRENEPGPTCCCDWPAP
jgi:hypothetical protein